MKKKQYNIEKPFQIVPKDTEEKFRFLKTSQVNQRLNFEKLVWLNYFLPQN